MFLIDTKVVSEARRGRTEAERWLRSVDPASLYLSVITLGEIRRGIELRQASDPALSARLTEWLAVLRNDFRQRVLPVDDLVALEWGRLGALRNRGVADGLIAATAIVNKLTLVTRNQRDFEGLPLTLLNPWASPG